MISKQYVENLYNANYQRTEYILNHYLQYKALEENVDSKVSQAFFELVSSQMEGKECFDNQDKALINKAGPYFVKTVEEAIDSIKKFPHDISYSIYPVLYYYFLLEASKGMIKKVSEMMIINDDIAVTEDEINQLLKKGIKMLSAQLFDEKIINALNES